MAAETAGEETVDEMVMVVSRATEVVPQGFRAGWRWSGRGRGRAGGGCGCCRHSCWCWCWHGRWAALATAPCRGSCWALGEGVGGAASTADGKVQLLLQQRQTSKGSSACTGQRNGVWGQAGTCWSWRIGAPPRRG